MAYSVEWFDDRVTCKNAQNCPSYSNKITFKQTRSLSNAVCMSSFQKYLTCNFG